MNDPRKATASIRKILDASLGRSWYEQLPAFNASKIIVRELREYLDAEQPNGSAYAGEKLIELGTHLDALFGMNDDGGHDPEQHYVWVLTALDSFDNSLPKA